MLIIVDSAKPLAQLRVDFEAAIVRHKFGVMGVHDIRQTMAAKGVDFTRECVIYEVCNPHAAKKALESRIEISTALPCRVSIYEEDGRRKLATIRPTLLLSLFNQPGLEGLAKEVEVALTAIMRDAAGGAGA